MANSNDVIDLTGISYPFEDNNTLHNCSVIVIDDDFNNSSRCSNETNLEKSHSTQDKSKLSSTNTSQDEKEIPKSFGGCPICWEPLGVNPLAATKCGHVYCMSCLEEILKQNKRCPTCRRVLKGSSSYHPLYLSIRD